MRLPSYPSYEGSGAEHLGELPSAWRTTPVKRRYRAQLGKMLQNEPASETDVLVPYLRALHVLWGKVNTTDLPQMWASPAEVRRFGVGSGDLLVCEGGEAGRAGMLECAPDPCIIQNAVHRVRGTGAEVRYLQYVLRSVSSAGWFDVLCNRATISHLTGEKLAELRIPLPGGHEQRAIADFLDRETAKLDALVAKKQALIERLKEKRSALISRTVTRGLPPDAARVAGLDPRPRLKPSGVDWIGEVPEQWSLARLKTLCTRVDVGIAEAATHAYCDDGVPIIRSANVRANALDTQEILQIESWFAERNRSKTLHAGDLVTVRTGNPGTTAVIPPEYEGSQCFTLVMSTPKPTECSRFLCYLLNASVGVTHFRMQGWGTAQTNISVPIVQQVPVCRPPLSEQRAIADFLDRETAKLDQLATAIEAAIERLQEYRAALITAAVTGKIDVRSVAASAPA
jgi:type I restriction enzyme S subunit